MDPFKLQPGKNNGVIEVLPSPTDFVAGAETAISATINLPAGDWRAYLPTDETQLLKVTTLQYGTQSYLETNACVTFSGNNELEMYGDFLAPTWPAEHVQWLRDNGYFDQNGKLNFSDRFTAKMSGTGPDTGNSLPRVWDSRKNDGLIPESDWPMPTEEVKALVESHAPFDKKKLQDIYYREIPPALIAKGKEFAKRFLVGYEWIKYPGFGTIDSLRNALKVAPIQIATAVCNGWNTDNPIQACGPGGQHATTLVNIEADGSYDIYDHYNPFLKRFASAYDITSAMRGIITPLALAPAPQPQPVPFGHVFNTNLGFGMPDTPEVRWLQKALQTLKRADGSPYLKAGVFGPFGPQTRTALALFQTDNGIQDPASPGTNFGPKGRAAMNALLAK